jgi:hypothetical protein
MAALETEPLLREYSELNAEWHRQVDTIWPDAPDLEFYPASYNIFCPDAPPELKDKIEIVSRSIYLLIQTFTLTPTYILHNTPHLWRMRAMEYLMPMGKYEIIGLHLEIGRNGNITIANKDEILEVIKQDEPLIQILNDIEIELDPQNIEAKKVEIAKDIRLHNEYKAPPTVIHRPSLVAEAAEAAEAPDISIEYDFILFINTHGQSIYLSMGKNLQAADDLMALSDKKGVVKTTPGQVTIYHPPPSTKLTFLSAVPIGIVNIERNGNEMLALIKSLYTQQIHETRTFNILNLQSKLREDKKQELIDMEKSKQYTKNVDFRNLRNSELWWNIAYSYTDRIYVPDPDWKPEFAILYADPTVSHLGNTAPITTDTHDLFKRVYDFCKLHHQHTRQSAEAEAEAETKPIIYRTQLLMYIYKVLLFKNPLIIDSSCAGFHPTKNISGQALRAMKKQGVAGGQKSKKKRKSRKRKSRKS